MPLGGRGRSCHDSCFSFARLPLKLSPHVAVAAGKDFRSMDCDRGSLGLALFSPPGRMVAESAIQLRVGRAFSGLAYVLASLATSARPSSPRAPKRFDGRMGGADR